MNALQRQMVHGAMVRLAQGDRDAFGTVFEELWPHLLTFVRRAVPGRPDAEDLAQQTLLKIFARISDFDTSRDGVAWAFGIAVYEVKTLRRQFQRRREVGTEGLANREVEADPSPEARAIQGDLLRALGDAMGELSFADRAVLVPHGNDEPAVAGTAAAWRKRRQRALERLRAAWRKRHA
jgi:RNA polymerase sigma-70 factor (ECF subfamily)